MEYKLPSGTASIEMDISAHMGEITMCHLSKRRLIVESLRESLEQNLRLTDQIKQLEARILMMSTIENNLRAGLKQLANPWVSVDTRPKTTDMSKDYYLAVWRNGRYSINGENYIRANADEITHWMPIPPVSESES
jgi:hypothetical protein